MEKEIYVFQIWLKKISPGINQYDVSEYHQLG